MAKRTIWICSCGVCAEKKVMKIAGLLAKSKSLWPERQWWWPKPPRRSLSNTDVHTDTRHALNPPKDMILETWEDHRERWDIWVWRFWHFSQAKMSAVFTRSNGCASNTQNKADFSRKIRVTTAQKTWLMTDESWGSAASSRSGDKKICQVLARWRKLK